MADGTATRVLLIVGAGVAAYKAAGVASRLRQRGYAVSVLLTPRATAFVAPLTFRAVADGPVFVDGTEPEATLAHIRLADTAAAVLVAPATADLIGRIAHGIADDLATTTLLAVGGRVPVLLAPAMNRHMWENPILQENVTRLRRFGYRFVGPETGFLAEGYEGIGRLADEAALVTALEEALSKGR